jgi:hypothetical protein
VIVNNEPEGKDDETGTVFVWYKEENLQKETQFLSRNKLGSL